MSTSATPTHSIRSLSDSASKVYVLSRAILEWEYGWVGIWVNEGKVGRELKVSQVVRGRRQWSLGEGTWIEHICC